MDTDFFSSVPGDELPQFVRGAMPFETLAAAIRTGNFRERELHSGEKVHHYRILEKIASGGMGTIYLAEHVYLKQRVALKTLRTAVAENKAAAERFLKEAQALALLHGPNVLKVQDASIWEDIPYVVTELLSGRTLSDHLSGNGPLTINQAMDLLEQIGDLLIRQEKTGILHRDIKPQNIWIRDDGSYCLIDYGLVEFTDAVPSCNKSKEERQRPGPIMGTLVYMSPEQAMGHHTIDHRTDLFGLGVTAWQALTGQYPRQESEMSPLLREAREVPIPSVRDHRSDVTRELARILESMTSMNVDDRYESASAFMEDLEAYRYGRRRPFGATRGSVFVAIPFNSSFDRLFDFLQDVCGEAKLAARRVDRVSNMKEIWHQIDKEIRIATIVIAVFTRERWRHAPNANVLTEAAHARAIDRPLIILTTDRAERLPFDWRHLPMIRYCQSKKGLQLLREELLPRLRQETRGQGRG